MDLILREITPLSEKDCFMIFSRKKKEFTFPLHIHAEYELNFIENGKGANRIIGDSVEEIDNLDLALIASPTLEHGWFTHKCHSKEIKEVTIQFHSDLFAEQMLNKNQFASVRELFDKAIYGVTFSQETIQSIKSQIYSLASEPAGAHSVLKLQGILCTLSTSSSVRELSSRSFNPNVQSFDSRRIEKAYNYMLENFDKRVKLSDVSDIIGMTEQAFSRFLKQKTGRNFIDSLNDIKLGHVTRMLVDTNKNIEDICLSCGFNNISNFNRIFKKRKGCTPNEFRENYKESKLFI